MDAAIVNVPNVMKSILIIVCSLLGKSIALFIDNLKGAIKMTTINEKQFNTTLKAIKTNADNLAQSIHQAGVFAIEQANVPENAMSFVAQAEAMPYWELTKQVHATMTVDWLSLLQGFLKRDETVSNNIKEGKAVTVLHPEVLEEVKALLVRIGNGKVLTNIDNNVVTL